MFVLSLRVWFFVFILFLFLGVLSACGTSNGPLLTLIPEKREIELGKLYTYSSIDELEGLYPEKEVQEYVERIGQKIAEKSERKVPYKFYITNSGIINAFALPGGPVIITRGLLLELDKESQLAGVLGHEIGHITARHHVKILEKRIALNFLLQIGSLLAPQDLTGELLLKLGEISAVLLDLKFNRDQEKEADRLGFLFMYKAGYSPQGMLEVFEKFKSMEKKRPPEWLSTHPLPETRIKEAKEYISQFKITGTFISDTSGFRRIKGLILETKPSYDYVEKGKKAYKEKKLKEAEEFFKEAIKLYPKNTLAFLYLSVIKLDQDQFQEAKSYALKVLELDPSFYRGYIAAGIACYNLKEYQLSLSLFDKASNLIPFNGISFYYKGRIYEDLKNYKLASENYKKALEIGPKNAYWYKDCYFRYQKL